MEKIKPSQKELKSRLHSNLAILIKNKGIAISELARILGISYGTLYKTLKPGENPTLSTLEKISTYFDVKIDSLVYSDISIKQNYAREIKPLKAYFIDELALKKGIISIDKNIQPIFIDSSEYKEREIFAKKLSSSSLSPLFPIGSILIFLITEELQDGDIALVSFGQRQTPVERRVMSDGDLYFFSPVNKDLGGAEQHTDFKVLGVMIKVIYETKETRT